MKKLTKREKKRILKIADIVLAIEAIAIVVTLGGFGVAMFAKLFEAMNVIKVAFPVGCIGGMVICLERMFLHHYVDMAIDIEEGYIK